jgi:hypothetical protein
MSKALVTLGSLHRASLRSQSLNYRSIAPYLLRTLDEVAPNGGVQAGIRRTMPSRRESPEQKGEVGKEKAKRAKRAFRKRT